MTHSHLTDPAIRAALARALKAARGFTEAGSYKRFIIRANLLEDLRQGQTALFYSRVRDLTSI